MIKLGVKQYGICNILGFNSPEWFIANNGSNLGGGIAAGIYATNGIEACVYITDHSKAEILVLEDNKQLAKYIPTIASGGCKSLKKIVMYVLILLILLMLIELCHGLSLCARLSYRGLLSSGTLGSPDLLLSYPTIPLA